MKGTPKEVAASEFGGRGQPKQVAAPNRNERPRSPEINKWPRPKYAVSGFGFIPIHGGEVKMKGGTAFLAGCFHVHGVSFLVDFDAKDS